MTDETMQNLPPEQENVELPGENEPEKTEEEVNSAETIRKLGERITELEGELLNMQQQAQQQKIRMQCMQHLRKRGIPEEAVELVVPAAEAALGEEDILSRVELLSKAVEKAAVRLLEERAGRMIPRTGSQTVLTGAFIRETPVARLAEMMGK